MAQNKAAEFLEELKQQQVRVKLYSGEVYEGRFCTIDGNLNLVLEDCTCV